MNIKSILFLSSILLATLAQDDESFQLTKGEEVAQQQSNLRSQNNMSFTNIRAYTFICGRFDDFVMKPAVTQETKIEMHVYWKEENVYTSSRYSEGEEIRVIVYEDNQRVIIDRQFYIETGFSFQSRQGSSYIIRFLAAGSMTKLVSMITSSPMQFSDDLATKVHIDNVQEKVEKVGNEIKALLTISQRNTWMIGKIGDKILSNTQRYMVYEVFEVLVIIGVAIAQVILLTRLLKGGSIV